VPRGLPRFRTGLGRSAEAAGGIGALAETGSWLREEGEVVEAVAEPTAVEAVVGPTAGGEEAEEAGEVEGVHEALLAVDAVGLRGGFGCLEPSLCLAAAFFFGFLFDFLFGLLLGLLPGSSGLLLWRVL
jgi:hypothetical protein